MRWLFRLVVLALLGAGGWYGWNWYQARKPPAESAYRTATVKRGDLLVAIGSTGTVEPEEVVDVGAQVAGKILSFGKDANGNSIDYGSPIEADSVLAEIEDVIYSSDLRTANAQVDQAKAGVTRAKADLEQSKARLIQAEADWKRAQELIADSLTQAEYDTAKANFEIAKANVDVSEASIVQANSSVKQAEAGQFRAERNLQFCTIKSPVSGVIIDRRVNIGQTVVSSLNAPSLFLIAKDLKRMEVWVAVNEADIGSIFEGQNVTFTCDAWPGDTFKGSVSKLRLNATLTQNVVTYVVEVTTDNSTKKLLPYLTANVSFEVAKAEDKILVPNTALRFTPASVLAAQASPPVAGTKAVGTEAPADKPTAAGAEGKTEPTAPTTAVPVAANGENAVAATGAEPKASGEESADPSARPSPTSGREGGGRHRGGGDSGGNGPPGEGGSGRHWRGGTGGGGRSGSGTKPGSRGQTSGEGTVWVLKGTELQSIKVKTGLTDDTLTEILSDNLPEGTEVLIGEIVADDPNATATQSTNPFAPPMMGRNRGGMGSGGSGGNSPRRGP